MLVLRTKFKRVCLCSVIYINVYNYNNTNNNVNNVNNNDVIYVYEIN